MKRKILILSGILVLVLLLGGAAYIGGRLLNGQGLPAAWSGLPFLGGGGNGQPVEISGDDIQPAEELPQTLPDERGAFESRQGKSIFIGTGMGIIGVEVNKDTGEVNTGSSHAGPTIEVVVTTQTTIYKDVTMRQFNGQPPEGQKIQQVVEPGSLDEIGQSSMVWVWGRKSGNRIIAEVLLYENPNG
jgi:hypothetical protein